MNPEPSEYQRQATLLIELLPTVARQSDFALYGGTAINLFLLDAPRLSIDLDLKFLPPLKIDAAKARIDEILQEVRAEIEKDIPGTRVEQEQKQDRRLPRLLVIRDRDGALVKIEVNPLQVGSIFSPQPRQLSAKVAADFSVAATTMEILAPAEIYAGKIAAALERAHPRDLFDIRQMPDSIWDDQRLWAALAVCLAMSRGRDLHRLIAEKNAGKIIVSLDYENFAPMMRTARATLQELEEAGSRLHARLLSRMPAGCKKLLVDFFCGQADWSAIGVDIDALPGLQWRSEGIRKMEGRRKRELSACWAAALQSSPATS